MPEVRVKLLWIIPSAILGIGAYAWLDLGYGVPFWPRAAIGCAFMLSFSFWAKAIDA